MASVRACLGYSRSFPLKSSERTAVSCHMRVLCTLFAALLAAVFKLLLMNAADDAVRKGGDVERGSDGDRGSSAVLAAGHMYTVHALQAPLIFGTLRGSVLSTLM